MLQVNAFYFFFFFFLLYESATKIGAIVLFLVNVNLDFQFQLHSITLKLQYSCDNIRSIL